MSDRMDVFSAVSEYIFDCLIKVFPLPYSFNFVEMADAIGVAKHDTGADPTKDIDDSGKMIRHYDFDNTAAGDDLEGYVRSVFAWLDQEGFIFRGTNSAMFGVKITEKGLSARNALPKVLQISEGIENVN